MPATMLAERERVYLEHLQRAKALGISLSEYCRRNDLRVKEWYQVRRQMVQRGVMARTEVGRRRIPVSALPMLARSLGVSLEELLGEDIAGVKKRGPTPKLQQQIERILELPRSQQRFVMQMLDTVLAQQGR